MGLATHIVVSKVHFWVIWDSYWLILWCQKTHIDSYCGVKSPFLSDLRLILWCQKSISEWFENPVNLGLKKELGLPPPRPARTMSPFFTVFFYRRASLMRDFHFWSIMLWSLFAFGLNALWIQPCLCHCLTIIWQHGINALHCVCANSDKHIICIRLLSG